eukprot:CAMPEP_0183724118 /NCGR_PEP_ID=MMETSP0737-20130205/17339_1 /TAXON_ID=385413 /ORGANISM="Thalassiosira miniscula, Strain CCMP1093" /LENGTH=137 /DNA_ID=CAMNT_0025954611 /DNA_START=127 /DNA_END=540 /DNA_ORIENTATION=+
MPPLYQEETDSCESSICSYDCANSRTRESSTTSASAEDSQSHADFSKSDDPFLYYSNDEVRIMTLKLKEVPETKKCFNSTTRKTRISFEVHPSLVLDEMFQELYGDEQDPLDDIDFHNLIAKENVSESELLTLLLEL